MQVKYVNPIYDIVFRYLMEDIESAKIIISSILNERIETLVFNSTENTLKLPDYVGLTVCRMDFKATIVLADLTKKVILIEIQKSKFESDIVRFRKYLGKQYQSNQNKYSDNPNKAIPIHTIYFLGEGLAHFKNSPIINVTRQCIDNYTKEVLPEKDDFVECLTHDCVVVQLDVLKGLRRNHLEKILSIFEASTRHILEIEEDKEDEAFSYLIRRLVGAYSSTEILEQMEMEDQIVNELKSKERTITEARMVAEEALKNEALALKNEAEERRQKEEAIKNEAETKSTLRMMILKFQAKGFSLDEIATDLGKTLEEIKTIIG